MTATDPTVSAMYRALLEAPDGEKDFAALVLADAIDDSGEDPARAELIRVQVELESDVGAIAAWQAGRYQDAPNLFVAHGERRNLLRGREAALLAAHRDRWLKVQCPTCAGHGYDRVIVPAMRRNRCPACEGTGDITRLMQRHPLSVSVGSDYVYTVTFRRGFPFRVAGATLAQLFELRQSGYDDASDTYRRETWQPTPLLRSWVAHHPTLEEAVPSDCRPWRISARRLPERWEYSRDNGLEQEYLSPPESRIPAFLYDVYALDETPHRTAEAATTAAARAVATAAKAHAARRSAKR